MNVTLSELLLAFSGFQGEVRGAPGWAESQRYDINAKADGEFTPDERGPMLLALLEDQFQLAIRHETKEQAGLALTMGKRPLRLEPGTDGETTIRFDDNRRMIFTNVSMPLLASHLRGIMRLPVVDHTGIAGTFDFSLDPDSFASAAGEPLSDRLRAALEAFGFRLESLKIARDITIIDHVERPSEN